MKQIAKKLNNLTSSEAAQELKRICNDKGSAYVQNILIELQDVDRKRHGSDDQWWDEMMHDAGEDISKLF